MISLKKLCHKEWFIYLGILCAIKPEFFPIMIPVFDNVLKSISLVFFPIIIVLYYLSSLNKSYKASPVVNLIFLLHIVYILSTLLNEGYLNNLFNNTIYVVGFCAFTDLVVHHNFKGFMDAIFYILFFYSVINFLTVLLFPNGIWYSASLTGNEFYLPHWFLSAKNNFVVYLIPALCVSIMRCYYYSHVSILSIIMFFSASLSILLTLSSTSIIALFVFVIFLLLVYKNKFVNRFHLPHYIVLSVIIFVSIVIFKIQTIAESFFQNTFNKSSTFTGRTFIWDWAMYWIGEKPILGSGYETDIDITTKLHDTAATHCHNMYLDIAYRGGFIALAIFILMFYLCCKSEKKYYKHPLSRILVFSIFVFTGILFLTEAYFNQRTFFMLLTMAYQIPLIVTSKQKFDNRKIGNVLEN